MNRRTIVLIETITTAVATASSAIVAYFNPSYTPAIIGSISVVEGAIVSILNLFNKE